MKTPLLSTFLSLTLLLSTAAPAVQAADYAVRQTWTLDQAGRWDYLDVDPVRHRLFLTRGDRVQVLDLPSGKVAGQIAGLTRAHGVAFAQALNRGYVTSGGGDSVLVFDLATLQTLQEVKVAGANPDALVFDEGSGKLYVFNGKSKNISVFDAATMAPRASIAVGGKPEFAVTDGRRVYVNIEDRSEIAVIDIATDRQVARWPLGGCVDPTGLALDAAHQRLFSVCQNGVLVVSDAVNGKTVARAAIGLHADAVVFDAASATVFSSNGDGTLSVIHQDDADHYGAAVVLRTEKGARTMAMDHDAGRLYLPTVVDKLFTVIVAAP